MIEERDGYITVGALDRSFATIVARLRYSGAIMPQDSREVARLTVSMVRDE